MGLKWLFMTMFSVLFHPESFWDDQGRRREGVNAMKDYAAPVIAVVQLAKLPFVGVPRSAMIMAIVSFIIDVAVLYVLSGAIAAVAVHDRSEKVQEDLLTMLCYSLTPLWLVEPFYFVGSWRWLFLGAALLYSFLILKPGIRATFGSESPHIEALTLKSSLLTLVATLASFTAITGLLRIFTSI
jgi:hypothetical protein